AAREVRNARREHGQCLLLESTTDELADLLLIVGIGMRHRQVQEIGGDLLSARREQREPQRPALIEERRALAPLGRQRLAIAAVPLREGLEDPVGAFAERELDFAQRNPRWCADREPALVDEHADRPAARAKQAVSDDAAGKLDGPRARVGSGQARVLPPGCNGLPSRATSSSIQVSTSIISCCTSLPSGLTGRPIETVITPGRLPRTPLGHK